MFRSASLMLLVLLFSLGISGIVEAGPDLLVMVKVTDSEDINVLRELPLSVNYRGDGYLVGGVDRGDLERFDGAGIEYEVIDEETWSEPYYLITRPQRRELGLIPDLGRVVLKTEKEALVKTTIEDALELARAGFRLTRLFPRPLPLIEERPQAQGRIRYEARAGDVIGAIVNQVSLATVGSYVQRLQDFQTRFFATDSIRAAAQWLYDRFLDFGYTDVVFDTLVEQPYGVKLWNVIATKPGILYPDSVIIIGGHYDSIVLDGTDYMVWAPGADDNGSGTAAVLEAARILANRDLDCTVKFACWTAEEIGLYGSWDYAAKAYNRGERIGLYLNFDMIGNLDESDPVRDVDILRNGASQAYAELMAEMADRYTTLTPFLYDAHSGSDHFPFMQYGYNIVYGSEGDFSPHWHRATDVIENMDIPYMSEVVKMGLGTLATLALGLGQPTVVYIGLSLEEKIGNGDGILDPGETLDLYVSLGNTGLRSALGISGELATEDPDVGITDNLAVFPDLDVHAVVQNGSDPFTFSLSGDAAHHAIVFTLHLSEGDGSYQTDLVFRLLIGQGKVLLVADDGGVGNQGYYIEAFQYLGIPYDIWEVQGMAKSASDTLLNYPEVIWFTGLIGSNTLTSEDQSVLETFLTSGGRLLLSGSLIGYDVGGTPFYRSYLHGRYVSFMTMLHHLNGTPSNPVVGEMDITLSSAGDNAQGFAGETDPISPAVSVFNYDRTTEEGPGVVGSSGSGALAVETAAYKVVYLSFGLEGVEPLEDRAQVLEEVLLWFKVPGVDKGDVDGNGTTNIIDAVIAVNIVLGSYQPTEEEIVRTDMNYDGQINILDVIQVVNAVLGSGSGAKGSRSTDM